MEGAKSGRKSDQFLAGLLKGFEKKKFNSPLPGIRSNCDVSQAATNFDRMFPFFLFNFWPKISSFLP